VTSEVEIMKLEEFSKQVDGENGLVLVRINRNYQYMIGTRGQLGPIWISQL